MSQRSSLSPHPASPPVGRNIISIASGKGGVGKTVFSVTLAHAMALGGARVLLFDGDLGLANVDIQLGLSVSRDLGQVFNGQAELANAVTPFASGGFDILAGPSGTGSLASLPHERLIEVRNQMYLLASRYDSAVLDLGAGVERPVRTLAALAGTCMVLVTDEPTSLTDAYAFIKLLSAGAPATDIRIVVNMAEDNAHGRRTYETLAKACESFLGMKPQLLGVVRRDRHVRDAIRHQLPLLQRSPNSDAASDIVAIAGALVPA